MLTSVRTKIVLWNFGLLCYWRWTSRTSICCSTIRSRTSWTRCLPLRFSWPGQVSQVVTETMALMVNLVDRRMWWTSSIRIVYLGDSVERKFFIFLKIWFSLNLTAVLWFTCSFCLIKLILLCLLFNWSERCRFYYVYILIDKQNKAHFAMLSVKNK